MPPKKASKKGGSKKGGKAKKIPEDPKIVREFQRAATEVPTMI